MLLVGLIKTIPEFSTASNQTCLSTGRHHKLFRIRGAQLVPIVQSTDSPVLSVHPLAAVFRTKFKEGPARSLVH